MDRHSLKRAHLPDHALFRASDAGTAGPDRPDARNLVEVPACASGVRNWAFASQLVQAPALAMAFVPESSTQIVLRQSARAAGNSRG